MSTKAKPVDPYQVLGIRAGATEEQIKRAYKNAAAISHPDAPGGNSDTFTLVQAAYDECLRREHQERWGTSANAIGAGIQAPLKQIEWTTP